jgi:hypothetical protein
MDICEARTNFCSLRFSLSVRVSHAVSFFFVEVQLFVLRYYGIVGVIPASWRTWLMQTMGDRQQRLLGTALSVEF